jgi:hypothetical protein
MIERRRFLWLAALALCARSSSIAFGQSPAGAAKANSTTWMAVSLRELKSNLSSSKATSFMGTTRVYGFIYSEDEGGPDCILITTCEPNRALLRLDDFKVAYENVKSSDLRPACTIDPRPDVLRNLVRVAGNITQADDLAAMEQRLKEFEKIACSDQDVRVFGIPTGTNFANVMLHADYDLKAISNGSEKVEGLASLTRIILDKAESEIAQTGSFSSPLGVFGSRFWFNPGEAAYRRNADAVLLTKCRVVLKTEEEAITPQGNLSGLAKADPAAEKFARDFTDQYSKIAKVKPKYRELENLYRFVALAELMLNADVARGQLRQVVEGLLDQVPVPKYQHKATLPGRYAVGKLDGSIPTAGGILKYHLRLPTCGGVSIDIRAETMKKEPDDAGRLELIASTILAIRPSKRAVCWELPQALLREAIGEV